MFCDSIWYSQFPGTDKVETGSSWLNCTAAASCQCRPAAVQFNSEKYDYDLLRFYIELKN